MNNLLTRSILLFFVVLGVIFISFTFAFLHHEDNDNRIMFSLVNQHGLPMTHQDFAGQYQLVFFGFTSCSMVCPTQMGKLTQVIYELESSGYGDHVTPIFISVDPERDTPEKINAYLENFHKQFIGLTGSRMALKSAADSFKTLLADASIFPKADYQILHSSMVYVVDPSSRLIDFISFEESINEMTDQIRNLL